MTKKEMIMGAVCELCHWPYVYLDGADMIEKKCRHCPVEETLDAVLQKEQEAE